MKTEDIIKVLENAKSKIGVESDYLCICLWLALKENVVEDYENITAIVPEFTRECAGEVVGTDLGLSGAWWNEKDKEQRIKFMDYLIDIYKKKL